MIKLDKATCVYFERKGLSDALKRLAFIISGKSTSPILKSVKFDVSKDQIIATATNGDVTGIVTMGNAYGNNHSQSFVVPYEKLNNFLKKCKADFIEMEQLDDSFVNIKSAKINYQVNSYPAYEYPILPSYNFECLYLSVADFKNAMHNTLFACATSDSRPVLQAVHITSNENGLQFIGTDSHRMGRYVLSDYTTQNEIVVNPNHATLQKILKLIDKNVHIVTMGFHENVTQIKFSDCEFWIKNIEGNYPNTERLFPTDFTTELEVSTKELVETLDTLEIVSKGLRNSHIKLVATKNETTLYASDAEQKMDAQIDSKFYSGEELTISFNSSFVSDALNALKNTTTRFEFSGGMRPFIMTDINDKNATHLILPVRTI